MGTVLGIIAAALLALWALPFISVFAQGLRSGSISGTCADVAISYGTPFKYNNGYPTKYIDSDVWVNTWADDGSIYAVSDDSLGWQGASSSNFQISQLSGFTNSLMGSNINVMASWGTEVQNGSDGSDYKATGLISVGGVLYLTTTRQINPVPFPFITAEANAQIIKSTNHGSSWTPTPPSTAAPYASPMFSGSTNPNPSFIQYGQDYQSQTADNSGTYVYATSNDGSWNNGNALYLGRVSIANLPNLNGSDWSYWQGGDGMINANWGAWPTAAPLIQNSKKVGALTQMQYFPRLGRRGCYVYTNWFYPSVAAGSISWDTTTTEWDSYIGEHPWGPWVLLGTKMWNSEPGVGLYSPNIMPKSVSQSGNVATATIATAGNFNSQDPRTGDYTLTLVGLTLIQN